MASNGPENPGDPGNTRNPENPGDPGNTRNPENPGDPGDPASAERLEGRDGPRGDARIAVDRAESMGGDPACWLNRVCDQCGRFIDDEFAQACPHCGSPVAT